MRVKNKKAFFITIITFLVCVIFIIAFNLYANLITYQVEEDTKNYVNKITKQTSQFVDYKMDNNFNTIKNIATMIESTKDFSKDKICKILNLDFIIKKYKEIGIIYPSGEGFTGKNEEVDYLNEKFFKQAMSKKTTFSAIKKDDSLIYVVATPVYKEDNVVCVLYGSISANDLLSDTHFDLHNCGNIYIVNPKSNEIISDKINSDGNPFFLSTENILSFFRDDEKKKFDHDISINQNGVLFSKDLKSTYYLGYYPLKAQGYYLISFIDNANIGIKTDMIKNSTLIFLSVIMGLVLIFSIFLLILYAKGKEKTKKAKLELETVIANIPGGVVRFLYDDCLTIQFLNDGLLKLTGFTFFDIKNKMKNSFLELVHDKDRESLASAIVDQMISNKTVEINCRLKCFDGHYSWFLFKGRMFTSETGVQTCLCVLTDINKTKKAQHELNLSMQRYRIVTEQSDSIIFEYNFKDHSIYLSDKWNKKFSKINSYEDIHDYIFNTELVYNEDICVLREALQSFKNGNKYSEIEIRILSLSKKYIWCRIKMSLIIDENDEMSKIIGKIVDIDKQKCETENLKKKAELDCLSGLYNKGTVQMIINSYLNTEGKFQKHAFLIFDIDDFKNINDTLGHLSGDKVIRIISSKIKNLVRNTDICGRVGGDEFIILLKNVDSTDCVKQIAEKLCNSFRIELKNKNEVLKVSGSIGISLYAEHGTTYNELLDKADTALYEAKKRGKDQFSIYGYSID